MKIIKLKKPTATISHPNDPDVKVTLERPSRGDTLRFQSKLSEYDKFRPAVNPETGEPFLDAAGKVRAMQLPTVYPASLMQDFLGKSIIGISGIVGEDQAAPALRDCVANLIEPDFDVTVKREVPEMDAEGKPTGRMENKDVTITFYQYLLERLNAKGTFDPLDGSPASTPSSTPATSD